MAGPVLFEETTSAFRVCLNRPAKRNAIGSEVIAGLSQALDECESVDPLKPFVVRGAGGWFASGGDIHEYADFTAAEGVAMAASMQEALRRVERLERTTIAAINGPAIGGGAEMGLAFDLRVMTDSAYFRFPETHLGTTTGWQGSERLQNLLGYSRALDLLLTDRQVDAGEAERIGLVNFVYSDAEFDASVNSLCLQLIKAGPAGLRTKTLLRSFAGDTISDGASERAAFGELWASEEHLTAMRAFRDRNRNGQ